MKKIILLSLIAIQIFIAIALAKKIWQIKKTVLGSTTVINLDKNIFKTETASRYQYYFEPAPNTIINSEFKVDWIKYDYVNTINSDSLNERFDYPVKKTENGFRIITLGDSFTYGLFNNTKDNWTEVLEDKLNAGCGSEKIGVINLGVSGYDIQYSLERFRLKGAKYNPDLVIFLLKNDDFDELSELMNKNVKLYTAQMHKSGEWDKLVKEGIPYPPLKRVFADMDKIRREMGTKKLLEIQNNYLNELISETNSHLILATFKSIKKPYKNLLEQINLKNKIPIIYLDDLTSVPDATFLPYDTHPSKKGHQIIAGEIYNYLKDNKILPCIKP